jgi:hypothetical protein
MPIRNPFRRTAGQEGVLDDRTASDRQAQNIAGSGAKPLQIKEPTEYKLSGKI